MNLFLKTLLVILLFFTAESTLLQAAESSPSASQNIEELTESLAFDQDSFNWQRDWWKYLLLLLVGSLSLLLLLFVTKKLLRLLLFLLSLTVSSIASALLTPHLQEFWNNLLGTSISNETVLRSLSYAGTFFACYLLIMILLFCIRIPFQKALPSQEKK